jgi:hypothetical protein
LRVDRGSCPNCGDASKAKRKRSSFNSIPHGIVLSTFHREAQARGGRAFFFNVVARHFKIGWGRARRRACRTGRLMDEVASPSSRLRWDWHEVLNLRRQSQIVRRASKSVRKSASSPDRWQMFRCFPIHARLIRLCETQGGGSCNEKWCARAMRGYAYMDSVD